MQGTATIALTRQHYKGWDSLHLCKESLELVLVPQVGGRILGMLWRGHDLSFAPPAPAGRLENLSDVSDLRARKREMGFPYWGGEKTWLAPQQRWTEGVPFLDLDSGPYQLTIEQEGPEAAIVRMTSQVCRETGIEITRVVKVEAAKDGWSITHRILNRSPNPIEWGIWGVSMVLRPGKVYLPRNPSSEYEGGVKTFLEEGESCELRGNVLSELGNLAVITCKQAGRFKFGVDGVEGWVLGILATEGHLIGYRKRFPLHSGLTYGHGCVAEVYNSDLYPYLEMEIHGPVVRLQPGESFELEEEQTLFEVAQWPVTEDEVRRYVESAGEVGSDSQSAARSALGGENHESGSCDSRKGQ